MYLQRDQAELVTTLDEKGPPTGSVFERFAFLIECSGLVTSADIANSSMIEEFSNQILSVF